MNLYLLAGLFFIIAIIYSSVGFGGGSSYIALLLLMGIAIDDVKLTALVCNVIVVLGATINYARAGLIHWKSMIPLVMLSIPMALLGGMIKPNSETYKFVASIALIAVAIMMLFKLKNQDKKTRELSTGSLSALGGGIGLLSGFIGIGGGIFLSPILHLIRWNTAKVIAAAASLFILVNSIAGIIGQLTYSPYVNIKQLVILACSVAVGGQIGNRLNIHILNTEKIKIITAILVGFVGIRLLMI